MKNKIVTLILSFVISFGLWLYVVTVISPESEATFYNVPVELVGTDYLDAKNLIIVSDTKNLKMDLKLSGNRSDLNKLKSSNITIIADLSKVTKPGEHKLACNISFQSGTADVVEQTPEYITVKVEEQASKTIPVKAIYTGAVSDGYEAEKENVTMDHTTVTVKGPKNTLEQVSYAGITVDLTNRMTSFVGDYPLTLYGTNSQPLISDQFITANVTEVSAVVEVNKVRKIKLNYELDCEDSGLKEDLVTLTPVQEVTLLGSDDALTRLDEDFVNDSYTFTIKLSEYTKTSVATLTLPLPEGVRCKEKIEVQIGLPVMDESSFTLPNSQFVLTNVPEGMSAQIINSQQIKIWGPKEVLQTLKKENLVIIMDCSQMKNATDFAAIVYTVQGYEYLKVTMTQSSINVSTGSTGG